MSSKSFSSCVFSNFTGRYFWFDAFGGGGLPDGQVVGTAGAAFTRNAKGTPFTERTLYEYGEFKTETLT